jgi:hypothetical protein
MRPVALVRTLALLLAALALGPSCTRAYLQNEGPYVLTAVEELRDECGLLSSPEALWDVRLQLTGDVVRMDSELMDMQLIGSFFEGGDDAFYLDGSVSHTLVVVEGRECVVDQVTMRLEGTTQCSTQFNGVMRVRYESRHQACECELWTTFRAVQNDAPCSAGP